MRAFITLNPNFQEQMKKSISNSKSSPFITSDLDPDKKPPTLELLQTFSRRQWESVLEKLFGGQDVVAYEGVIELFETTGLMERIEGTGLVISSTGYKYLFKDPFSQIW
eukprot:CAMPEP_0206174734 /NCGR_PEP_ID=MMETSP1474-20131121/52907_1 /ASSEMBLY_ACC=CAM_ASM_001110 /TAXON_ID=97495 /ORGANISM="Imantonia sp., Strain RCC918" /LENGTH=108 /DNA_ID=CAMNT_0053584481 /DNA_START=254 /DNA_END=577 /DNA_ORIENTATION=-